MALEFKVSVVHVYRKSDLDKSIRIEIQEEGDLTIYRVAYSTSIVKFWASARGTRRAIKWAKRQNGPINRVFLNVFYPLGAHIPWISKWIKAPIYALEHWTGFHESNPTFEKNHRHLKMARYISSYCKRVIGVSEDLNNSMRQNGLRNVGGVVFNVVDERIFNWDRTTKTEQFRWLHISTLKDQHKNFRMLLRSFAELRSNSEPLLTVINSGDYDEYKGLIKELGIQSRVRFTGKLSLQDVASLMKESDAFVLSSNFENMPCVIAEALSSGLPVVSTNVGGISEVINKENGRLVDKGDTLGLTRAMMDIEQNKKEFNNQKIASAAVARFGRQAVLKQMKEVLGL